MEPENKTHKHAVKVPGLPKLHGKELTLSLLAASFVSSVASSSAIQQPKDGIASRSDNQIIIVAKRESVKSCHDSPVEYEPDDSLSPMFIASRTPNTKSPDSLSPDRESLKTSPPRSRSKASKLLSSSIRSFCSSFIDTPKSKQHESVYVEMKDSFRSSQFRTRSPNKSHFSNSSQIPLPKSTKTRHLTKFIRKPFSKISSAAKSRELIFSQRKSHTTISTARCLGPSWSKYSGSLSPHSQPCLISKIKSYKSRCPASKSPQSSAPRRSLIPRPTRRSAKSASPEPRTFNVKLRNSLAPNSFKLKSLPRTSPLSPQAKPLVRSVSYVIHSRSTLRSRYSKSPHFKNKLGKENNTSADKSKQCMESLLSKNMDVRYITELKNYIEKLMTNLNCQASVCPSLQERLQKHRIAHHSDNDEQEDDKKTGGREDVKGNAAQTKLTLANLGNLTITLDTGPTSKNTSDPSFHRTSDPSVHHISDPSFQRTSDPSVHHISDPSFRRSSDMDELSNQTANELDEKYILDIDEELKQWVRKFPIYEDTPELAQAREYGLQVLKNKLLEAGYFNNGRYNEAKIKNDIDSYLDSVKMWYPGSKRDREAFKEGLREYIYKKVYETSQKYLEKRKNLTEATQNIQENGKQHQDKQKQLKESKPGKKENKPIILTVDKHGKASVSYEPRKNQNLENVLNKNPYNDIRPRALDNGRYLTDNPSSILNQKQIRRPSNKSEIDNRDNENLNYEVNGNEYPTASNYNHYGRQSNPLNQPLKQRYVANGQTYGQNIENEPSVNNGQEKYYPESNQQNYDPKNIIQIYGPNENGRGLNYKPKKNIFLTNGSNENGREQIYIPNTNVNPAYEFSNYEGENFQLQNYRQNNNKIHTTRLNKNNSVKENVLNKDYSQINMKKSYVIRKSNDCEIDESRDEQIYKNNEYYCSDCDLFENYERKTIETCKPGAAYSDLAVKKTLQSKDLCFCPNDKKPKMKKRCCGPRVVDMEKEVANWLKKCTFLRSGTFTNRTEIIDTLLLNLTPYLSQPSNKLNKAVLKAKIISTMNRLSFCTENSGRNNSLTGSFADELANRLIGIVSRLEKSCGGRWKCTITANKPYKTKKFEHLEQVIIGPNEIPRVELKHNLLQEINECLQNTNLANDWQLKDDIVDFIIEKREFLRTGMDDIVKNGLTNILEDTDELSDVDMPNIVNNILESSKDIITMINNINNRTEFHSIVTARTSFSGTLSIYTSEHEIIPYFDFSTSTPKKKKVASKIGPEEQDYTEKVATTVREWIKEAPEQFNKLKDIEMNDVIINDLAFDIVERAKLAQILSCPELTGTDYLQYSIFKWLVKFDVFKIEELEDATGPHIKDFVQTLHQISIPKLVRSQHATSQTIKNRQFNFDEQNRSNTYVPEAKDILEDVISIWLNEYPSDIYLGENKSVRNKLVHEFADDIQSKLVDKRPQSEISEDIRQWLNRILKLKARDRVQSMTHSLVERLNKLPQEKTITENMIKRMEQKVEETENIRTASPTIPQSSQVDNETTLRKFVVKYIEHHHEAEDTLTKRAYAELLKFELQMLGPIALTKAYESELQLNFTPEKLNMELAYAEDISDWLKTVPMDAYYNTSENSDRVEFVISLAKDIAEVEEERRQTPNAMDFNAYLVGIIYETMSQLPIPLAYKQNGPYKAELIDQLLAKIATRRRDFPTPASQHAGQNIFNFIEEHMKGHGQEIVNDKLKLEVWAARLLKELKNVIAEAPTNISRADVQDRIAKVPIPSDETVRRFSLELEYAKEISEWLKNFSLVNEIDSTFIRDLAARIAHDDTDSNEVYISQWITQLPLDEKKVINIPTAKQQLNMRIKKVKENKRENKRINMIHDIDITIKRKFEISKNQVCAKAKCSGCCPVDAPGVVLVKLIEDWCEKLPLGSKEEDVQKIKKILAIKIFRITGELNNNPRFSHNPTFYIQALSDATDALLDDVSKTFEIKGNKEVLKTELLNVVAQARAFINDVTAGDHYKKQLEDTVDKSVPNAPLAATDPGFDLFKENITDMFILKNFDHSSDAEKFKYEKKILGEIGKYTENAQSQNGNEVQKKKLYNDVYSALYNVEIPNEEALVEEVEIIKTKCEVENWFETLPLKPPVEQDELLYRNHMFMLLSKRIYQYEAEKAPKEQIHKEIIKLLEKFPLHPGNENNIEKLANDLLEIMEKTEKSRKCVKASDIEPMHQNDLSVLSQTVEKGDADEAITEKIKHVDETDIWVNPESHVSSVTEIRKQKPADMIIQLIETWSNNIPLPPSLTREQQQLIKNEIATKIIIKVFELNSDPKVFNSDILYSHLLGEEIEKLLATLPPTNCFLQSKDAMKFQLVTAIDSIKPLIKEDKQRQQYQSDLKNTVNYFIDLPKPYLTTKDQSLNENVKEEIVNNFIEYQYNKDDDNGKQYHKNKIVEVLTNYYTKNLSNQDIKETRANTLLEANRLVCEMSKFPVPGEQVLKDEVEAIRMNQEVQKFLDGIFPSKTHEQTNEFRNILSKKLTKTLNYIEITGHNQEIDKQMKAAINKSLNKFNTKVGDAEIDYFIKRLKRNEKIRKAPPVRRRRATTNRNISLPVNLYPNQKVNEEAVFTSLPITSAGGYTSEYQDAFSKGPAYKNLLHRFPYQQPTPAGLTEYQAAYCNAAHSQLPPQVGSDCLNCSLERPSMLPPNPTSDLQPLIMSYPTVDAKDTWNVSNSRPQAMQQALEINVHRPVYVSPPRPLTHYAPAHVTHVSDSGKEELVVVMPQATLSTGPAPMGSVCYLNSVPQGESLEIQHFRYSQDSQQLDAQMPLKTQCVGPSRTHKNVNMPSTSNFAVQTDGPKYFVGPSVSRRSGPTRSESVRQRQEYQEEDDCFFDMVHNMMTRMPCIPMMEYCDSCEGYAPVFRSMPMPPMWHQCHRSCRMCTE